MGLLLKFQSRKQKMFLQCPLIFCCLLPFPLPSPVMEVPPQKSGSCWREIVPPMARHALGAAGQLLTTFAFHLLCRKGWFFPPPLPERSPQVLAKSSTFQCCPEEGPLWQVPSSPLFPKSFPSHFDGMPESPIRQSGLP